MQKQNSVIKNYILSNEIFVWKESPAKNKKEILQKTINFNDAKFLNNDKTIIYY